MEDNITSPDIPVACSLTERERAERGDQFSSIFSVADRVRETERGYALRYSESADMGPMILDLVLKERVCCPFFEFRLVLEPGEGPLWLYIEGPKGTKEMISPALEGLAKQQ